MICQSLPGLASAGPKALTLVPSISHTAGVPLSFCHRMSALPSSLKSAAAVACQLGPGLASGVPYAATLVPPISHTAVTAAYMPALMNAPHSGSFTSACGLAIYRGTAVEKELKKLLADDAANRVAVALKKIGYLHVTLDLLGYRRGSVNEAVRAAVPTAESRV